jgi:hypothetical protein
MRDEGNMKTMADLLIAACMAVSLTACATRSIDTRQAQAAVDRLMDLQEPHKHLLALWESGKWQPKADVNLTRLLRTEFPAPVILAAFPRLSLPPGTTLDYVYHKSNMGGWPVLYSRPVDATPFDTFAELTNAMPHAQARGLLTNTWSQGFGFYLDDIQTDGTVDGYFQLIALYLMGDQFFNLWHDGYHDERIICTPSGLDDLFQKSDSQRTDSDHGIPDEVRAAAHALPLAPRVDIQRDTVRISVVVFTKWGGFQQRTFTVSRRRPHALLHEELQELVNYSCGYVM